MMTMMRIALWPAMLTLGACAGPSPETCVAAPALARALSVSNVWAVPVRVEAAPGVRRDGLIWFVAAPDGATWVTDADPLGEGRGMILPLNDRARDAAVVGREAPVGDPIFAGITDMHPGAAQARECAISQRAAG